MLLGKVMANCFENINLFYEVDLPVHAENPNSPHSLRSLFVKKTHRSNRTVGEKCHIYWQDHGNSYKNTKRKGKAQSQANSYWIVMRWLLSWYLIVQTETSQRNWVSMKVSKKKLRESTEIVCRLCIWNAVSGSIQSCKRYKRYTTTLIHMKRI